MSAQGPEDHARLAEDFPSPSAAMHLDMAAELERQAAAAETTDAMNAAEADAMDDDQAHDLEQQLHHAHHEQEEQQDEEHDPNSATLQSASTRSRSLQLNSFYTPTPHAPSTSHLPSGKQLEIMREFYVKNPHPSRAELEMLAEKTGRTWRKVREYFRQRRNKGRGLGELDNLAEPARATGWLQLMYRAAPSSSSQSQLGLYSAYKTRFDPYHIHTPLMTGQELIQLAIATFPGCEMARDEGEYVLKGVDKRERTVREGEEAGANGDGAEEGMSRGIDGLAEPVRASTWLLNNFQPSSPTSGSQALTQTDLYTAYATRFSFSPPPSGPSPPASTSQLQTELALNSLDGLPNVDEYTEEQTAGQEAPEQNLNRMLDPVELITLARMTFPDCEPVVDEQGRFVIRGMARREGVKVDQDVGEMFPFAAMNPPHASSPSHPLTSLLKRKLAQLHPDAEDSDSDPGTGIGSRKRQNQGQGEGDDEEITADDRKLIEGLKRFRGSRLGSEVRDACVSQ